VKKNVELNQDEIITKLLAENTELKIYAKTSLQLIVLILSKIHEISEEKAWKILDGILKYHESVEKTRLKLNLGAFDDEIQSLLKGD